MATYGFNEGDAKRIGHAVREVERNPVQVRLGGPHRDGATPGVRMMVGKIDGDAWGKNSGRAVTIFTGTPGSEASAATVSAWNYFADISTSANTARWVGVSNNGWGWVLIAAECDTEAEE
jgi:hypothetical protein